MFNHARALKPGGLYLFATINRTLKGELIAIKAMQQWPLTRLTDVAVHDWDIFIAPAELAGILSACWVWREAARKWSNQRETDKMPRRLAHPTVMLCDWHPGARVSAG